MNRILAILALAIIPGLAAQPGPPAATWAKVEFDGKIEKVQAAPGQGMPFIEVRRQDRLCKVYLGSMRYLMENNFNPKAGESIKVTGFERGEDVLAKSVTLGREGKELKLRDENGLPLWRGGRHGWGQRGK